MVAFVFNFFLLLHEPLGNGDKTPLFALGHGAFVEVDKLPGFVDQNGDKLVVAIPQKPCFRYIIIRIIKYCGVAICVVRIGNFAHHPIGVDSILEIYNAKPLDVGTCDALAA